MEGHLGGSLFISGAPGPVVAETAGARMAFPSAFRSSRMRCSVHGLNATGNDRFGHVYLLDQLRRHPFPTTLPGTLRPIPTSGIAAKVEPYGLPRSTPWASDGDSFRVVQF